jgi:hypothetical protein
LSTQIKQVQDKNILFSICKDDIGNLKWNDIEFQELIMNILFSIL